MSIRRPSIVFAAVLICLGTLTSHPVQAYIPPSEYIVKSMLQKKAGLKMIRTRGTVMALTAEGGLTGARFIEEALFDSASGVLRSTALDETGRELYSVERQLGQPTADREPRTLVSLLLFESRPGPLLNELRRWDIPVREEEELLKLPTEVERRAAEQTFFGRQKLPSGLLVSWVIGDRSSNQLWVQKDKFVPARLLLRTGDAHDIQFDSYQITREVPMPRVMLVSKGKEQVLREEIQDITINSAELIETKKTVANGFTEIGDSAESEIRDLIRRYYSVLR